MLECWGESNFSAPAKDASPTFVMGVYHNENKSDMVFVYRRAAGLARLRHGFALFHL